MRNVLFGVLAALLTARCAVHHDTYTNSEMSRQLAAAEAFIDAFYAFDAARLRFTMARAESSQPRILFYQGWAEGGNYRIVDRLPCTSVATGEVQCAITVSDDLIPALGLSFNVTDTFHLTFAGENLVGVRTTSNDPPVFEEALQWIGRERPSVLEGPCQGFFAGGPTPGDCVRAVVQGFRDFTAARR